MDIKFYRDDGLELKAPFYGYSLFYIESIRKEHNGIFKQDEIKVTIKRIKPTRKEDLFSYGIITIPINKYEQRNEYNDFGIYRSSIWGENICAKKNEKYIRYIVGKNPLERFSNNSTTNFENEFVCNIPAGWIKWYTFVKCLLNIDYAYFWNRKVFKTLSEGCLTRYGFKQEMERLILSQCLKECKKNEKELVKESVFDVKSKELLGKVFGLFVYSTLHTADFIEKTVEKECSMPLTPNILSERVFWDNNLSKKGEAYYLHILRNVRAGICLKEGNDNLYVSLQRLEMNDIKRMRMMFNKYGMYCLKPDSEILELEEKLN